MWLIVNADDFGASEGVSRGILEAHERGIVTSTSLMVTGDAAAEAVESAREHPKLDLGLHWVLDGHSADPGLDLNDPRVVREELRRQLEGFRELVGRPPTHLDTHHHIHLRPELSPLVSEVAEQAGLPLRRRHAGLTSLADFYGQDEAGSPAPERITVDFLFALLGDRAANGWTEIVCHPGYVTDEFLSSYRDERETELRTLTDPRLREEINARGIRLATFADLTG